MKVYQLTSLEKGGFGKQARTLVLLTAMLVLALGIIPTSVAAEISVVDQSYTALTQQFYYNIEYFAPMGQEFTPTLHALDVVELWMDDASCSSTGSPGGDVQVRIRESTISGSIIGTSYSVHFPNCYDDVLRFDFPSFVPLVPGQVYVIEAVYVSGNTSGARVDNGPASNYPGGSLIMEGILHPDKDMWFIEGLDNSIPTSRDQCKQGGWQNSVRHDGTTFKNQGDCIQYVNTGK